MYPLIDAHEDLAWNILTFHRDYTQDALVLRAREREAQSIAPLVNGDTLLGWPQYVQGGVVVVFATLFAAPMRRKGGGWDRLVYETPEEARRLYNEQWQAYRQLVQQHSDRFRLITTRPEFEAHWQEVTRNLEQPHPVGLVLLMENAEAIEVPDHLAEWYHRGLRLLGPAWAGTRFCGGTGEPGPMTDEGRRLLREMAEWNLGLDISHMDEPAALEALDTYPGTILASHANPRRLLRDDGNRHLSDQVLRRLFERDGVVGIVPYNRFLDPRWRPSDGKEAVSLQRVAEMIDYVCQLAGNARHVGIGSDFDGGFGYQHVPAEVETIADLQRLAPLLRERGYTEDDLKAIFAENWKRLLQQILPEEAPRD